MVPVRSQPNHILLAFSSAYGRRAVVALLALAAFAQTPAQHAFEVASIKPADPNARGSSSHTDRRMVRIENWTAKRLVQRAFGVEDYQITGGPNWLDSYHFNINAKVDEAEPEIKGIEGQKRLMDMYQALLAERFQFQFHRETKTLPIYHLVTAKSGFKLTPVKPTGSQSMSNNGGRLTVQGVDMPALAVFLSRTMERPVLDTTGITGVFDFKLEWTQPQDAPPKAGENNDPVGPSIFTALQEQLGLRLEIGQGSVVEIMQSSIMRKNVNRKLVQFEAC